MYGWLCEITEHPAKSTLPSSFELLQGTNYRAMRRTQQKFLGDKLFFEDQGHVVLVDGYILNTKELMCSYRMVTWADTIVAMYRERGNQFVKELRGSFNGFILDKRTSALYAFTNHIGDKAVFYYTAKDRVVISSNLVILTACIRNNGLPYSLNEKAAEYLLTHGYMLDDTCIVREIKRLLPGHIITFTNGSFANDCYYRIDNTRTIDVSETEAIDQIDNLFRDAVRRGFEKDIEYGYEHLVDLSGGLDSRLTTWVAKDLGYSSILNICYSQSNYYDEKIAKEIATHLGNEFIFKTLDDASFVYDIDDVVKLDYGMELYTLSTGSNRLLRNINFSIYGLEHTGQLGDVVVGSYIKGGHEKPTFGSKRYSDLLSLDYDNALLTGYPNHEMFLFYTRGLLGTLASHFVRQNYTEVFSPFTDVDLMDYCFSLPIEYRVNHNIYLKWINRKYPGAARFMWESARVSPTGNIILKKRVRRTLDIIEHIARKVVGMKARLYSMNPYDHWYKSNSQLRAFVTDYFRDNIACVAYDPPIHNKVSYLFENGNFTEKCMAITVLGAVGLFFGGQK